MWSVHLQMMARHVGYSEFPLCPRAEDVRWASDLVECVLLISMWEGVERGRCEDGQVQARGERDCAPASVTGCNEAGYRSSEHSCCTHAPIRDTDKISRLIARL